VFSEGSMSPATSTDSELLSLGQHLERVLVAVARTNHHGDAMDLLDETETIYAAITAASSHTLHGLYVKARATAWASEYDYGLLNPGSEPTITYRLAASIVRDLLRLRKSP
jgi:hypothetical protein